MNGRQTDPRQPQPPSGDPGLYDRARHARRDPVGRLLRPARTAERACQPFGRAARRQHLLLPISTRPSPGARLRPPLRRRGATSGAPSASSNECSKSASTPATARPCAVRQPEAQVLRRRHPGSRLHRPVHRFPQGRVSWPGASLPRRFARGAALARRGAAPKCRSTSFASTAATLTRSAFPT